MKSIANPWNSSLNKDIDLELYQERTFDGLKNYKPTQFCFKAGEIETQLKQTNKTLDTNAIQTVIKRVEEKINLTIQNKEKVFEYFDLDSEEKSTVPFPFKILYHYCNGSEHVYSFNMAAIAIYMSSVTLNIEDDCKKKIFTALCENKKVKFTLKKSNPDICMLQYLVIQLCNTIVDYPYQFPMETNTQENKTQETSVTIYRKGITAQSSPSVSATFMQQQQGNNYQLEIKSNKIDPNLSFENLLTGISIERIEKPTQTNNIDRINYPRRGLDFRSKLGELHKDYKLQVLAIEIANLKHLKDELKQEMEKNLTQQQRELVDLVDKMNKTTNQISAIAGISKEKEDVFQEISNISNEITRKKEYFSKDCEEKSLHLENLQHQKDQLSSFYEKDQKHKEFNASSQEFTEQLGKLKQAYDELKEKQLNSCFKIVDISPTQQEDFGTVDAFINSFK